MARQRVRAICSRKSARSDGRLRDAQESRPHGNTGGKAEADCLHAITHEAVGDGFEDLGAGIGWVGHAEAAEFDHSGTDGGEAHILFRASEPGGRGKRTVHGPGLPERQ